MTVTFLPKMIIAVGSQDRHYDDRVLDIPHHLAIDRLNRYCNRFKDIDRTWIIPGPDQLFSNSPELLKALKKWSQEHGTLIHIHSSEEPRTTAWFTELDFETIINEVQLLSEMLVDYMTTAAKITGTGAN